MSNSGPLDPIIHEPARLRIMSTLAALHDGDSVSFNRLSDQLGLTAGNLTTHLRRLTEAGFIEVTKTGRGRASSTVVQLTDSGRTALEAYVSALRAILDPAVSDLSLTQPGGTA